MKIIGHLPDAIAHLTDEDRLWLEDWVNHINKQRRRARQFLSSEQRFGPWLQAALRLIEPHIVAGRTVPIGEILRDARWGVWPLTANGGLPFPKELGPHGGNRLVHPQYADLVRPLEHIPIEWLKRVEDAVIMLLELRYGPLGVVGEQRDHPDHIRRVQKYILHSMCPSEPRHYGSRSSDEPDYLPGSCLLEQVWRHALHYAARQRGWERPDDAHRLRDWLPVVPCKDWH